jgi:hypothetical protein
MLRRDVSVLYTCWSLLLLCAKQGIGLVIGRTSPNTVSLHDTNSSAWHPLRQARAPRTSAFIIPGKGEGFQDGATAELLRFVTAYGRGFETLVDLTPYSPLLHIAKDVAEQFSIYSFIDTWVGNDTGRPVVYVSNTSGTCHAKRHSHGNGWMLDAELLFWNGEESIDGKEAVGNQPYASVTVASGPTGDFYSVGKTSVHEGHIDSQGIVTLDEPTMLEDALRAHVYDCQAGDDIRHAAVFGHTLRQIEAAALAEKHDWLSFIEDRFYTHLALPYLQQVTVVSLDRSKKLVNGTYHVQSIDVQPGMPVFISPWDVFTDKLYGGSFWLNSSFPLTAVGTVTDVSKSCDITQEADTCIGKITLHIPELDASCLPSMEKPDFPGFFLPIHSDSLKHAQALAKIMRSEGESAAHRHGSKLKKDIDGDSPLLLRRGPSSFDPMTSRGVIDMKSAGGHRDEQKLSMTQKHNSTQNDRVCVVVQRQHGRFLQKQFDILDFDATQDRALLQVVITGHGWEATSESCGEYCHAVYQLRINDHSAANITQWRDDCSVNPLGDQDGTWKTSRNGWCPGSVQPGQFIDVTTWLVKGANSMTMDLAVRSSISGAYGPYVDHSGFSQQEDASLIVAATLFFYDQATVQKIHAQPKSLSPAEEALRSGSSNPKALMDSVPTSLETLGAMQQLPLDSFRDTAVSAYFDRLVASDLRQTTADMHRPSVAVVAESLSDFEAEADASFRSGPLDFQARAPWHLLRNVDRDLIERAHRVPAFSRLLVQGQNRWNEAEILREDIPENWHSVALRLKLSAPAGGLTVDAWDRAGSFGIHFKQEHSRRVRAGEVPQSHRPTMTETLHVTSP